MSVNNLSKPKSYIAYTAGGTQNVSIPEGVYCINTSLNANGSELGFITNDKRSVSIEPGTTNNIGRMGQNVFFKNGLSQIVVGKSTDNLNTPTNFQASSKPSGSMNNVLYDGTRFISHSTNQILTSTNGESFTDVGTLTTSGIGFAKIDIVWTASANFGSSTTGTFTFPTSPALQEGDEIIVLIGSDGGTPALPSGWTSLGTTSSGAGGAFSRLIRKTMTATPDTSVALSSMSTATTAVAIAVRNLDTTTKLDAAVVPTSNGTGGSPDPGSITTVSHNALVVAFGVLDDDNDEANILAPAGYSNLIAKQSSTVGVTTMLATKEIPVPGAENPGSFTSSSDEWVAYTVALRPGINTSAPVNINSKLSYISNSYYGFEYASSQKGVVSSSSNLTSWTRSYVSNFPTPTNVWFHSQDFAAATSATVTFPVSPALQQGDLVIVSISSDTTPSIPAGWTSLHTISSGTIRTATISKVMGASPDTSVTFTGVSVNTVAVATAYRNASIESVVFASDTSTNGLPNPPAISTNFELPTVLLIAFIDDIGGTLTPPAGYTSGVSVLGTAASPKAGNIAYGSIAAIPSQTATATIDPAAYTHSSSTDNWSALTISLRSGPTVFRPYAITQKSGTFLIGGSKGELVSTTDFTSFTDITPAFATVTDTITALGVSDSLFVLAIKSSVGVTTLYTSPDAVTWTQRTISLTTNATVLDIKYLNSAYYLVDDTGELIGSTDGITWSTRHSGTGIVGTAGYIGGYLDPFIVSTSSTTSSLSFLIPQTDSLVGSGLSITPIDVATGTNSRIVAVASDNQLYYAGYQDRYYDYVVFTEVSRTISEV